MSALRGKRVLAVEDEPLVAFALEDLLLDLGCEVVGPAVRLSHALELARAEPIDLAVLDVNLGTEHSYPVADALATRAVPFLFATGYGAEGIDASYAGVPRVCKPYGQSALETALLALLSR